MGQRSYEIAVEGEDDAATGRDAMGLADDLREVKGVLDISQRKGDASTMDLGAIISVVATSGATIAIAQGIAEWLRRRRGTRLKIERDPASGSIKAEIQDIDPEAAVRIVEIVRGG